jgi:hypothetical protein
MPSLQLPRKSKIGSQSYLRNLRKIHYPVSFDLASSEHKLTRQWIRQVNGCHTRSASPSCEACSWDEDLQELPGLELAPLDSVAKCIQLWQNGKTELS